MTVRTAGRAAVTLCSNRAYRADVVIDGPWVHATDVSEKLGEYWRSFSDQAWHHDQVRNIRWLTESEMAA